MTSIKIIWFFLIKKERVRSDRKGEKGHFIDYYVIKNDNQGQIEIDPFVEKSLMSYIRNI